MIGERILIVKPHSSFLNVIDKLFGLDYSKNLLFKPSIILVFFTFSALFLRSFFSRAARPLLSALQPSLGRSSFYK